MSLAWTSGCSCSDLRACVHICFRKYNTECTRVAVMLAKLMPYAIANVIL